MDKVEGLLQAIEIGVFVACFLCNTGRILRAIELLNESLVLLNNKDLEKEHELRGLLYIIVYFQMLTCYIIINDQTNAIECGKKLLILLHEYGQSHMEGIISFIMASSYKCQAKYDKAKELYMRALNVATATGKRELEEACYVQLAALFYNVDEYRKAKKYIKKALEFAKDNGKKKDEATHYGNLGTVFDILGEYVKAEECHEKALLITKEIGDQKGEAAEYGKLGAVFHALGEYGKAGEFVQKALQIRKEIGDNEREAIDYGILGNVFQSLGKYVKAEEYHKKALEIRKKIGDKKGEATDYGNLGTVFQSLGEYVKAEEYYKKALVIRKQIGDKRGEAADCGNLGTLFHSLGEYDKAQECHMKALVIRKEIGDKKGEATDYGNMGILFHSIGECVKAVEYHEKALVIRKQIGDKGGEAADYGNLGSVFQSLGDYVKAEEYHKKALMIRKEIGDKQGEAVDYGNLGLLFHSLGDYAKAEEYHKKALAIRKEIGDKKGEATDYGNLGIVFQSFGEYVKAEEYYKKALVIRKQLSHKEGEAADYGNLATLFGYLGDYSKAKECQEKALDLSNKTGNVEQQFRGHLHLAWYNFALGGEYIYEAVTNLYKSIEKCEEMRSFLRDKDDFKVSFFDKHVSPYQLLSALFITTGNPIKALYVVELARARALADLMSAKYSLEQQISMNQHSWVGIEKIMEKESNCVCLYISYYTRQLFFWILKAKQAILFRKIEVDDCCSNQEAKRSVDEVFGCANFRASSILPQEECEDRTLSTSNVYHAAHESSLEDSRAPFRQNQNHERTSFSHCYKMIIAPVADLLDEPEIIIAPDRVLYNVPFAALEDESGKSLSESFRIRIVPSLTTLKLIQKSPADYHSRTGALIVGDPEVGHVIYKGQIKWFDPLPCARKEAEMIGRLLGTQPLSGKEATKRAVLENMRSASLIHFAAHGNAERGEIALAPSCPTNVIPLEEDYLLTMTDISQVRLTAKLVVLSCCHSARGKIKSEGVVGIARAFLGSGVRSVLVALWAIDDEATMQLMSRFYKHLVDGESASESLHQTMKWMRGNGFLDVREWAPFMLIGDNVTFDFKK